MTLYMDSTCVIPFDLLSGKSFEMVCQAQESCSHSCDVSNNMFNCNSQFHHNNQCLLNCDGTNCAQTCNQRNCGLECGGGMCTQICSNGLGQCTLTCNGDSCEQTCDGGGCSLVCDGNYCSQTCRKGTCSLGCYGRNCNQNCDQQCNLECRGESCTQDCFHANDICQLQCPTVNDTAKPCEQNCPVDKTSLCTKKSISTTREPTTLSKHCHSCTGE